MDYLEYKGYKGSVEYSKEDNCLFGKVQGMRVRRSMNCVRILRQESTVIWRAARLMAWSLPSPIAAS